jgi:cytochrome c biogenesis protein CcdA
MLIEPAAADALLALALGFAFAGVLASGFEVFTTRKAGFSLLQAGGMAALASVPLVVFTAPFLIIRNTVRAQKRERRPVHYVMLATMIACVWSLACGRVVMDILSQLV